MDVAERQEVLKAVIVIRFFAVGPSVSSCEPAALDHASFQVFTSIGATHGVKVTQGGIMPPCESIKR